MTLLRGPSPQPFFTALFHHLPMTFVKRFIELERGSTSTSRKEPSVRFFFANTVKKQF